jgi:hypothetical protein
MAAIYLRPRMPVITLYSRSMVIIKMMSPEYLTINDLATYASVSRNTLKKWLGCGMPSYRVDGCLRVRKGEFDTWMRQFRSGTESKDLDSVWDKVMEEVTC